MAGKVDLGADISPAKMKRENCVLELCTREFLALSTFYRARCLPQETTSDKIGSALKVACSKMTKLADCRKQREVTAGSYAVRLFILDHFNTHTYSGVNCHLTHGQNSFSKHLH